MITDPKIFEFKFAIGQKVWSIMQGQEQVKIPCEACNSQGRVPLLNKEYYSCPKCYGKCHSITYKQSAWYLREKRALTIGQQSVERNYTKLEEKYMCVETGIGGGSVYYVQTLFGSESEAKDECNKRNINEKLDVLLEND